MRVVVTGSAGLVGRAVIRALRERGTRSLRSSGIRPIETGLAQVLGGQVAA